MGAGTGSVPLGFVVDLGPDVVVTDMALGRGECKARMRFPIQLQTEA